METLMTVATAEEVEVARETLASVVERGDSRDKGLFGSFGSILAQHPPLGRKRKKSKSASATGCLGVHGRPSSSA